MFALKAALRGAGLQEALETGIDKDQNANCPISWRAYIAPERDRCSHPAVIHPIHHTLRQHRSLGRIVLRRAFLTSDATATLSFMSVIVSARSCTARWGKHPIPNKSYAGKVTDEKEACETSRPKIEKTTLKAGQRSCSCGAKTAPREKFPRRSRGKDQIP